MDFGQQYRITSVHEVSNLGMIRQFQQNFRDGLQRNVAHILEEWYLNYRSVPGPPQKTQDPRIFSKSMELLHHVYVYCNYAGFGGADSLIKGFILRIEQLQYVDVPRTDEIKNIFDECRKVLDQWSESIRENPRAQPEGAERLLERFDAELLRLRSESSVYNFNTPQFKKHDSSKENELQKKKLLIVESSSQISDLTFSCLSRKYQVTRCSTRSEALRELKQESFDLLITDIVSSTPQSLDFIKVLRTQGIPVIVVSGVSDGLKLKTKKLLDVTIVVQKSNLEAVAL